MGAICSRDHLLSEVKRTIPLTPTAENQNYNRRFRNNRVKTAKYTWWNFIPFNLATQFSKAPNVYFLLIAILQTIQLISISNGKSAMAVPLVFVIAVGMVKDAFEDYKRHKNDNKENNSQAFVFDHQNKNFGQVNWSQLWCGDIVKLEDEQEIPADLLILSTSEDKGIAYVETKNLDGETNLKLKTSHKEILKKFPFDKDINNKLGKIEGHIETEGPNNQIYKFDGMINLFKKQESLNADNFVLKGSKLRNTELLYGVVIYTGHHTKVMMNSSRPRNKISDLERLTNRSIIIILITQIILSLIAAIYGTVKAGGTQSNIQFMMEGIEEENLSTIELFIQLFGSWILMLTNFVPISLMVTLDLVKFWQGMFMSTDFLMYNEEEDEGMRCQSSNLNEQLGQVEYIFSDKTGTLTCNIMEFRKFTAGQGYYGTNENGDPNLQEPNVNFYDPKFDQVMGDPNHPDHQSLKKTLIHLAVCHTVIIDEKKNIYSAASPDELALVYAAKQFGLEFMGIDSDDNMIVQDRNSGQQLKYKLLNTLEFSSARKRMSVIVKDPQGRLLLLCKGADSIVADRLTEQSRQSNDFKQTQKEVDKYANEGLRTLFLSEKYLDPNVYQAWNKKAHDASLKLQGRDEAIEAVNEEIEVGMTIVGSTAIEDRLQDCVADVIRFVKQAGIKVWVLTGDKVGTAINIGVSAGLLDSSIDQYKLIEKGKEFIQKKIEDTKPVIKAAAEAGERKQALIVGGATLITITEDDNLRKQFVEMAEMCDVVLACRVSPKQKADIVNLIKDKHPDKITLAIGDGANDVNMIQQAHVGVGIFGKEGQQAARSADFAIGQFRFLKPLMFIHGREAYRRNSFLVLYTFYKNILYILTQYVFGFWSGFSGQVLYEPFIYQMYNVTFTSVPIMYFALFDFEYEKFSWRDFKQKASQKFFMSNPELYQIGLDYSCYTLKLLSGYIFYGLAQSLFIYVLAYQLLNDNDLQENGKTIGFWIIGHVVFGSCIIVANMVILFRFNNFTGWGEWTVAGMILAFYTLLYIESLMPMFPQTYYIFDTMMEQPIIWFHMISIAAMSCLFEYARKVHIARKTEGYYDPEDQPKQLENDGMKE